MPRSATYTLSLILSVVVVAATCAGQSPGNTFGIIDRALTAVGSGSAGTLKDRLFTDRITVVTAGGRRKAIEALPDALRRQRITQGRLFRRIETDLGLALQLHDRLTHGQVELFLFHDEIPTARLWRGGILVMSDGLAEALNDSEIIGIIAHELGHSYFEDEMAAAQRTGDARTMRVIELKCDAVAIISLKLLGQKPMHYLQGLKRMKQILRRESLSSGILQTHPEIHDREQFLERLLEQMQP